MNSSKNILQISNKDDAFLKIEEMNISCHQKSLLRLKWKKKYAPDMIRQKKMDENVKITELKKQIDVLQNNLEEMLKNTEPCLCCLCGNDTEGHELPCKHDLCYKCYYKKLVNNKIQCSICGKIFNFDTYDLSSSDEEIEELLQSD
jgi:hypothetical protein